MSRVLLALWVALTPVQGLFRKARPEALVQVGSLNVEGDTPVTRVVNLLKEMQKGLQGELEEDKDLYGKLTCWCATSDRETDEQIAADNAKVTALETTIAEEKAKVEQFHEEIATLEKEISADKQELAEATAIREKQLAAYREATKATTEDIESLKAAILVLQKHHPESALPQLSASFLSIEGSASSAWTAVEIGVLDRAMQISSNFMQTRTSVEYVPRYASQSGEILGVLKQLLDEMAGDIAAAEAAELENKKAFDTLSSAKQQEIAVGTQEHKEKSLEAKETELSSQRNTAELERTQESLDEERKFMSNLNATCSDAGSKYDARHKQRLAEIQAISETIEILMEDNARDHFSRTYNGQPEFLQLAASSASTVRLQAVALLQRAARRSRSPGLSLLASQMELDAFTKVKAAIDKFLLQLRAEQQHEVEEKDYCEKSIHENELSTTDVLNRINLTDAAIAKTANEITAMTQTIGENKNALQETEQSFHDASLDRAEASLLFQRVLADQRATEQVLKKALNRMAQFYNTALLEQTPPVAQKEYKKHEGGAGVMELLKKIIGEARELQAESFKAEQGAVNAYGKLVLDTHAMVEAKEKEIVDNKEDLAALEETLEGHNDEKASLNSEFKKLTDENMELHASCDYFIANFDLRQQHRADEIEALEQAKGILSGATFD